MRRQDSASAERGSFMARAGPVDRRGWRTRACPLRQLQLPRGYDATLPPRKMWPPSQI